MVDTLAEADFVALVEMSAVGAPPWSARETELLEVTLQLLQEHGYDRLTVDTIAAKARASKATVYRRWPSKAELVLAAFIEGVQPVAMPPATGTLRGDLLLCGKLMSEQVARHANTLRAVLPELSRHPALRDALQREFLDHHNAMLSRVLRAAVDRGEIPAAAAHDEVWDVLPGYLLFRSVVPGRHATDRTVQALVDDLIIPSLMRSNRRADV